MTNKIEGYEDSHPVNSYRLRFTSDAPSGQIVCRECKATSQCTVMGKCGKCYDEQNGGDEPSPIYTREELAKVIHQAQGFPSIFNYDSQLAIVDALIAIGEVRVK